MNQESRKAGKAILTSCFPAFLIHSAYPEIIFGKRSNFRVPPSCLRAFVVISGSKVENDAPHSTTHSQIGSCLENRRAHAPHWFPTLMNNAQTLEGSYFIRLQGLPDLVLTNKDGQVQLDWRHVNDPNQLWTVYRYGFSNNLYWLKNQGAGGGLNATDDGDHLVMSGDGVLWYVGGDLGGFNVIRMNDDDNRNLNALGGWPCDVGTHVGVWSWSGGAPNELWQLTRSDSFPFPRPTNYVQIGSTIGVSVAPGDQFGTQPLVAVTLHLPIRSTATVFDKIDAAGHGFALRSQYTEKFLSFTGPNQPVGWADTMSLRCVWTSFPVGEHATGIRPLLDNDQNLNFAGGYNLGAQLYTWTWSGGQKNETWSFTAAYP